MTIYRRVVSCSIGDTTATEILECGHENILYRRIDEQNRVAWYNQRSMTTNLSAKSRECSDCEVDEADKKKGWTS